MYIFLTVIHVFVCLFLVVVVLLQSGKAADLAGAFGGMGSQTVFGPRGSATVLSRATTISAIAFMITSMSLSILATRGGHRSGTLLDTHKAAPVQPSHPATTPGTAPVTVQPSVDGQKQAPQNITVPVVPDPNAPKQPQQKK